MRIADTSGLYAAFAELDAHHAEARKALAQADPLVVPAEIFAETVDLIQYRFDHGTASAAGGFLRALPHVEIRAAPARVLAASWEEFLAAKGRVSVADAVVIAWCRAESAPAFSFDKEIVRRSKQ